MLVPVIITTSIGLAAGICLAVASKYFTVKKDPRLEKIQACLLGANCGACGYPGCTALAAAIAGGEAPADACPGVDEAAIEKISAIIGSKPLRRKGKMAVILCGGGKKASDKYEYSGPKDCISMSLLLGGIKNCSFGCLGGGSCASVCPFGAVNMGENGLPEVSPELCTGCGLCVPECPRGIITLKNRGENIFVLCSSRDKASETRKNCSAGCIGCRICEKNCHCGAVSVTGFLASVDGDKCISCRKCVENCPVSAVRFLKMV